MTASKSPTTPKTASESDQTPQHNTPYTGVVLIHGLGPIKRNGMLQQSLNALTYWYDHVAGLALRSEGPGRVWLAPALTDNPDPDQPASHATMELVAPGVTGSALSGDGAALLEFREVWWAESFGLPDIAATIAWARVQWREQWKHLLVPIGIHPGPGKIAIQAPAREIRQALTYRPSETSTDLPGPAETKGAETLSPRSPVRAQVRRGALRSALWLYDYLQYGWKALQWLILTPLIALLLLVMGLVKLLAVLPFLQPTIVAALSAVSNTIMLHWIAEIRVYLLDYTRSSAIRQRFEREVDTFLRDPLCECLVVIAESGGTYIAYEGLTTALAQPDLHPGASDPTASTNHPSLPKPVTFICLASALRRIWLLANSDSHRLHGVLPQDVRWLHFWARYDPVAAGPLNRRSLPRITKWSDPTVGNPYEAICKSLNSCENVDVANSDSTFTDHVGYWDNLEQVVGPIACELVAGHPTLSDAVRAHLATPDDILWRRWRVAWRASLAIGGGLAAGAAVIVANALTGGELGHTIVAFVTSPNVHKVVFALLTGDFQTMIAQVFGPHASVRFPANPAWLVVGSIRGLWSWAGQHIGSIAAIGAALVAIGVVVVGIGEIVAIRPPSAFPALHAPRSGPSAVLILWFIAAALVIVSSITNTDQNAFLAFASILPGASIVAFPLFPTGYVWQLDTATIGIGVCLGAWLVMVVDALVSRRWLWLFVVAATAYFAAQYVLIVFYVLLSVELIYGLAAGRGWDTSWTGVLSPLAWLKWIRQWRAQRRPGGVLIVAILASLVGIYSILNAIAALHLLGYLLAGYIGATRSLRDATFLVLGMLEIVFALGALRLRRWAWILGIITQVLLMAFFGLIIILTVIFGGALINILELFTVVAAGTLFYLLRTEVRNSFWVLSRSR